MSAVSSYSLISSRLLSIHLRLGRPLLLFPGTTMSIIFLDKLSSSLLLMCPYKCNRFCLRNVDIWHFLKYWHWRIFDLATSKTKLTISLRGTTRIFEDYAGKVIKKIPAMRDFLPPITRRQDIWCGCNVTSVWMTFRVSVMREYCVWSKSHC